jgi:hypothetical protein
MHIYNRLVRALPELEGGIIAVTSRSDADDDSHTDHRNIHGAASNGKKTNAGIFLPAGTIYAAYAAAGGFLCRAGFASRDAISTATACVAHALDAAAATAIDSSAAATAACPTAAASPSGGRELEPQSAAEEEEAAALAGDSSPDDRRVAAAAAAEASAAVLVYSNCLADALLRQQDDGCFDSDNSSTGQRQGQASLPPAVGAALAAWVEWQPSLLASEELLDAVAPVWKAFLVACRDGSDGGGGGGSGGVGEGESGSGHGGRGSQPFASPELGEVTAYTLRCPCALHEPCEDFVQHWAHCHLGALSGDERVSGRGCMVGVNTEEGGRSS